MSRRVKITCKILHICNVSMLKIHTLLHVLPSPKLLLATPVTHTERLIQLLQKCLQVAASASKIERIRHDQIPISNELTEETR
jgi:hypothetical protein